MLRLTAFATVLAIFGLGGCSGSDSCNVPTGSKYSFTRSDTTDASNTCAGDATASGKQAVAFLTTAANAGAATTTTAYTCGESDVSIPVSTTFSITGAAGASTSCTASEHLAIDFGTSASVGTDDATVTCDDGTACVETFDVVLTAK